MWVRGFCLLVCTALVASHTLSYRHIMEDTTRFKPHHRSQFIGRMLPPRLRQNGSPSPLAPDDVKAAYNYPTSNTAGIGHTIAIIDAYDNPNIESDLAVFSTQFNLPACTTANGCFKKVNQTGSIFFQI
jgi:hypothetical protein